MTTVSLNMPILGISMLEQLSQAVVLLDSDLAVLYVNSAAEKLFAASSACLLNASICELCWEKDSLDALENAQQDGCSYTRREARLFIPTLQQDVILDYTVTPLMDDATNSLQFLMELQPQERQLRLSREDSIFTAYQATRSLVRGMAHEIKNPLGGIRGAAQLLASELNAEQREYTDVIISEADRLRSLLDRMLGSREQIKLQPMNIHQALERVRMVIGAEVGEQINLVRDYDPSIPELEADLDQIIQVLLNIVRNAAQALTENPPAEPARILLKTRILRQFTLNNIRQRLVCLIEIEDNGPGISPELQETLFYPMVTGRALGTGLGLPIAQSIMHQHGGLIECDSYAGKTRFRIYLPCQQPPA